MTNQEKAKEITSQYMNSILRKETERKALEMAEWKDSQFTEYLEKKIKSLQEENKIWQNSNLGAQIMILQRCKEEFKEKMK